MKLSLLLLPILGVAFLGGALSAAEHRPNIVFILADDLGWNGGGVTGNRGVDTPHLDRLAAQGMRFTQAYAEAQCSPTRGALFSGQWPARTHMFAVTHETDPLHAPLLPPEHLMVMPPETASLFRTLRGVGYATGMSGKWHIAHHHNSVPLKKRDNGNYFDAYGIDFVGDASNGHAEKDKSIDAITADGIAFIERNRDRPFMAYLAHHAPHAPMEAPKALVEKYVARGFKRSSSPLSVTAERPTADYAAMLDHLDAGVGRVLAKLDELGLTKKTVVIFASDNGGLGRMADLAPLRESKGAPYEGGLRVPFLVRWPGRIAPGSVSAVPIHAVDYYPTFAALAGATVPAGHRLDGENLVPLLTGKGGLRRDTLYWHMPTYTAMYGRTPCAVVRRGEWKLIRYFGDFLDTTGQLPVHGGLYGRLVLGARTELYHISSDVSEARDVAALEPARVKELSGALDTFLAETNARLPQPNPAFRAGNPEWWRLPKRGAGEP